MKRNRLRARTRTYARSRAVHPDDVVGLLHREEIANGHAHAHTTSSLRICTRGNRNRAPSIRPAALDCRSSAPQTRRQQRVPRVLQRLPPLREVGERAILSPPIGAPVLLALSPIPLPPPPVRLIRFFFFSRTCRLPVASFARAHSPIATRATDTLMTATCQCANK